MSVRPNLGLLGGALIAGGALICGASRFRTRVELLLIAGAAALAALAPWFGASQRAVGTPSYLLDSGNQVAEPIRLAPANGVVDLLEHALDLLGAGPYVWVAVLVLVAAVALRRLLPDGAFAVIATVVTLLVIALVAVRGYAMARIAFVRYTSPMSAALAVFFFCEVLRALDVRATTAAPIARLPRAGLAGLVAAAGLVAISFSSLGLSLEYSTWPGGATLVARAFGNDMVPNPGYEVTTPALRAQYRRALADIDPDASIAAVDRPYLIDFGRYDIPTMDLPGFTAPGGKFPFLTGPRAKIARVRRAGYQTLLVTDPNRDVALAPPLLRFIETDDIPAYTPTARYYLDWEEDLAEILERAPGAVRRYNHLFAIDLRRAERDLARAGGTAS
jgi:hypothetical protein